MYQILLMMHITFDETPEDIFKTFFQNFSAEIRLDEFPGVLRNLSNQKKFKHIFNAADSIQFFIKELAIKLYKKWQIFIFVSGSYGSYRPAIKRQQNLQRPR